MRYGESGDTVQSFFVVVKSRQWRLACEGYGDAAQVDGMGNIVSFYGLCVIPVDPIGKFDSVRYGKIGGHHSVDRVGAAEGVCYKGGIGEVSDQRMRMELFDVFFPVGL